MNSPKLGILALLCLALVRLAVPAAVEGQIIYVSNSAGSPHAVQAFDAITGAVMPGFTPISPLANPQDLAVVGTNLYVVDISKGVGVYDATTGAVIHSQFITSVSEPIGLAISGGYVYVSGIGNGGTLSAFDLTTGAAVPGFTTITGLTGASGVAVSGNDLFVAQIYNGQVDEFDATTGAPIAIFNVPKGAKGLAVSGNNLYVGSGSGVGVYDISTGNAINASLISFPDISGMALVGNDVYLTGEMTDANATGILGEFDVTTGQPVSGFTSPSGLRAPNGMAYYNSAVPEPGIGALLSFGLLATFMSLRLYRRTGNGGQATNLDTRHVEKRFPSLRK